MAIDYSELYKSIDSLIVDYKTNDALKLLEGVSQVKIPDSQRALFAALARRLARPKMALKILHPNVLDLRHAKAEDIVEYATNLRRLGLIHQCRRVLGSSASTPLKNLHLAFCSIHHWDYPAAQQELQEYLKQKPDVKMRLLAEVNLAAAHIYNGNLEMAEELLRRISPDCERIYPHLYLNCLELNGQLLMIQKRLNEARKSLDKATSLVGEQEGFTTNQIEKWDWILRVHEGSIDPAGSEVSLFRQRVRRAGDWETLRHFDWQLAKASGNLHQIQSAYFCTPYEKFKALFVEPMPRFMTRVDPRFDGEPFYINSITGEGLDLPFGLTEHRLLVLMLSDKYQPWTVQRIFDFLYSDENFDPFTSPRKIYQLVDRLAKNVSSNPGLELSHSRIGYRLRPLDAGHCHVFEKMIFKTSEELLLSVLRLAFGEKTFKVEDLKVVVPSLSVSKSYRALQELHDQGSIKSVGSSKTKSFVLV